jgi:hypothetical protein
MNGRRPLHQRLLSHAGQRRQEKLFTSVTQPSGGDLTNRRGARRLQAAFSQQLTPIP